MIPIEFNCGGPITISKVFPQGNTYFSINVIGEDMSLSSVLNSLTIVEGDYIKNNYGSATYYDLGGWFGQLTTIDPKQMYHIKLGVGGTLEFNGIPVDVANTPINLFPGWTWIGYLPQESCEITEALSSLTLTQGDYIKNNYGSATYYDLGGWFGLLSTLEPVGGYKIKLLNADVLTYPESCDGSKPVIKTELPIFNNETGVEINPSEYEFNGTLTANVYFDNQIIVAENDLLLSYVENDCRGIAEARYFAPDNKFIFPIMIYSNAFEGETITFKYFNSSSNEIHDCIESIGFAPDMIHASAFEPFNLHLGSLVDIEDFLSDIYSIDVSPNPFSYSTQINISLPVNSELKISVFNLYGMEVEVITDKWFASGSYSLNWETKSLTSGTYYIAMRSNSGFIVKKILHIK
nr:T9SS type A sorting domain-containing protein [Bacteroidota bacterium]